jgi:hypothetical protein
MLPTAITPDMIKKSIEMEHFIEKGKTYLE